MENDSEKQIEELKRQIEILKEEIETLNKIRLKYIDNIESLKSNLQLNLESQQNDLADMSVDYFYSNHSFDKEIEKRNLLTKKASFIIGYKNCFSTVHSFLR